MIFFNYIIHIQHSLF